MLLSTYVGPFKNGLAEGTGVYKMQCMEYSGEFSANMFHGGGKLTIYDRPKAGDVWVLKGLFKEGSFISGMQSVLRYLHAQ